MYTPRSKTLTLPAHPPARQLLTSHTPKEPPNRLHQLSKLELRAFSAATLSSYQGTEALSSHPHPKHHPHLVSPFCSPLRRRQAKQVSHAAGGRRGRAETARNLRGSHGDKGMVANPMAQAAASRT